MDQKKNKTEIESDVTVCMNFNASLASFIASLKCDFALEISWEFFASIECKIGCNKSVLFLNGISAFLNYDILLSLSKNYREPNIVMNNRFGSMKDLKMALIQIVANEYPIFANESKLKRKKNKFR